MNITEKGRKYLGSPIGTLAFCESFSMDKVSEWTQELEDLAKIAVNDPRPTGLLFSICVWAKQEMVISDLQEIGCEHH